MYKTIREISPEEHITDERYCSY